jgi:mercuric ion transport protein
MNTKKPTNISPPKAGFFAGISVFSGLGALAAKSCCILPFLLASSGIGSAWLSRELAIFRPYFLTAALLTLVIGWVLAIRRNRATCQTDASCATSKAGWTTFTMLGLATVFVGLSALWDFLQPVIFEYLKNSV